MYEKKISKYIYISIYLYTYIYIYLSIYILLSTSGAIDGGTHASGSSLRGEEPSEIGKQT